MPKKHRQEKLDLEPIQYFDIFHEDDMPLANVRESAYRILIYFGAALMIIFVIVGSITPMSRSVLSKFVVRNINPELNVRFFDDIYLLESLVQSGDHVPAEAPLIRFNSPQITNLITAHRETEQEIARFTAYQAPLRQSEMRSLEVQQRQKQTELDHVQRQIAREDSIFALKRQQFSVKLDDLRQQVFRNEELFTRGMVAEEALIRLRTDFKSTQFDSSLATQDYHKTRTSLIRQGDDAAFDLEILKQDLVNKQREMANEQSQLVQKKEQVWDKIKQMYGHVRIDDGSLTLLAEFEGTISYLVQQHEGTVGEQTTILRLQPAETGFRIESSVSARDIGRVKSGTPFKLRFDAFPRSEFGFLEGEITTLSITSDKDGKYPFQGSINTNPDSKIQLQASLTGLCYIRVSEGVFFSFIFDRAKKLVFDTLE